MEARYLMLDPRSYELEHEQMFAVDTCQFCGCKKLTYRRFVAPPKHIKWQKDVAYFQRGIAWVQRCQSCKKTVSTIKRLEKK